MSEEHAELIRRARALVGAAEFERRVDAAKRAGHPERDPLDTEYSYCGRVNVHLAAVRLGVARDVLDGEPAPGDPQPGEPVSS